MFILWPISGTNCKTPNKKEKLYIYIRKRITATEQYICIVDRLKKTCSCRHLYRFIS